MLVRIPGWARGQAIPSDLYTFQHATQSQVLIIVNGEKIEYALENGYAVIKRKWKKGDVLQVQLPMNIDRVTANEKVTSDIGKIALQRGPIMYCAEWVDNNGKAANMFIPENTTFTAAFSPNLLSGVELIKGSVPAVQVSADGKSVQTVSQPFTAIPYYAWANRGKGEMMLWFPQK